MSRTTSPSMTAMLIAVGGLAAATVGATPARASCCAGYSRPSQDQSYQSRPHETSEQRQARLEEQRFQRQVRRALRAEARAAREAAKNQQASADAAPAAAAPANEAPSAGGN
jgi:hypothetical protein